MLLKLWFFSQLVDCMDGLVVLWLSIRRGFVLFCHFDVYLPLFFFAHFSCSLTHLSFSLSHNCQVYSHQNIAKSLILND